MAPESKTKKRKASSAGTPSLTKKKKFVPPTPKNKSPSAATPAKKDAQLPITKKATPTRKKAADFYSDNSSSEDEGWAGIQEKAAGKGKKGVKPVAIVTDKKIPAKKSKKASEPELELVPEDEDEKIPLDAANGSSSEDGDSSADEEIDNQTATLLKGFESSDEEEDGGVTINGKAVVKAGIPDEKSVKKKIKGLAVKEKSTPGVIYLGRIPHGFYENEMKQYFSQFGDVTRLRLSRNKRTGQSKHFAFIEFDDEDVAKVAAETMNNYLLFGHILKCRVVPRDNLEYIEKIFKGANKRFKKIPVAKLAKAKFEKKKTEEKWASKIEAENRKRKGITEKLKAKGIDYEFNAPVAKKAKTVAVVAAVAEVTTTTTVETEVIEEKSDNTDTGDTIQVVINTKKSTTTLKEAASPAVAKKGKAKAKATAAKETVTAAPIPAKKSTRARKKSKA